MAAVATVVAVLAWTTTRDAPPAEAPTAGPEGLTGEIRRFARIALLLLLAIGVETGIGGWAVALSDEIGGGASVLSLHRSIPMSLPSTVSGARCSIAPSWRPSPRRC